MTLDSEVSPHRFRPTHEAPTRSPSILWIVPELQGGIASYSERLFLALKSEDPSSSFFYIAGQGKENLKKQLLDFKKSNNLPEVIHIQHEYGLFGGKLPHRYWFPEFVSFLKQVFPNSKIVITAHTVLDAHFRYSIKDRGIRKLFYILSNWTWVPWARHLWGEATFGKADLTFVHSKLQIDALKQQGAKEVKELPHFVPKNPYIRDIKLNSDSPLLVTFGYFSKDKGQDLLIEAARILKAKNVAFKINFAGGVRLKSDEAYLQYCRYLIQQYKLEEEINILGFIDKNQLPEIFNLASLVIAPFRHTTGSGSLAEGLSYGSVLLTSDLPLNLEIEKRVPGSLFFFKHNSAESLAKTIEELLLNLKSRSPIIQLQKEAAYAYANLYSIQAISKQQISFYAKLLNSRLDARLS